MSRGAATISAPAATARAWCASTSSTNTAMQCVLGPQSPGTRAGAWARTGASTPPRRRRAPRRGRPRRSRPGSARPGRIRTPSPGSRAPPRCRRRRAGSAVRTSPASTSLIPARRSSSSLLRQPVRSVDRLGSPRSRVPAAGPATPSARRARRDAPSTAPTSPRRARPAPRRSDAAGCPAGAAGSPCKPARGPPRRRAGGRCPRRSRREQPDLLVVAQRPDGQPGPPCHLTDLQGVHVARR